MSSTDQTAVDDEGHSLAWTGERCLPWTPDVQVVYEHLHRYLIAAELFAGARVLDLGCGEGYGSAILASAGCSVTAVDVDEDTIRHAQGRYGSLGISFVLGDACRLDTVADASVDAVVCIEVIEHLAEHDLVLGEIKRVLAPGGTVLLSSPDREYYSERAPYANPFHVKELSRAELDAALSPRWAHHALFGQWAVEGSHVAALDAGSGRIAVVGVEQTADTWRPAERPHARYLLAIASDAPLAALPQASVMLDYDLHLVQTERRRAEELVGQAAEAGAVKEELALVRTESERVTTELVHARQRLTSELAHAQSQLGMLRSDVAAERARSDQLRCELGGAYAEKAIAEESVTWRAFLGARRFIRGPVGQRLHLDRASSVVLQRAGRVLLRTERRRKAKRVHIEGSLAPSASIVIAVHAGADVLESCLRSIAAARTMTPFEVVITPDDAPAQTLSMLRRVTGVRVLDATDGDGFLASANRAAASALGEWLVFLNDDTVVTDDWLDTLIERAETADDIGAVGAQLRHLDGRLQEAGSIIWSDGTGWNYGNGDDPERSRYRFAREVDYASGAALLVGRDAFGRLGGFDARYAPAFYEDTDLCFGLRGLGLRVMYEPRSCVLHRGGSSYGDPADASSGSATLQQRNREHFVAKWREALAQQRANDPAVVAEASDRSRGPRVLVIDHEIPTPDQNSGSVRMVEILRQVRDLGARVTFLPDNGARYEPYSQRLGALGVETLDGAVEVRAELARIAPDLQLVILSRPHVAARWLDLVRELAPWSTVVYDTVDLYHLREQRRALAEGASHRQAEALRELELAMVRACDVTFAVTAAERTVILGAVPEARVEVMPNLHRHRARTEGLDGREGIVFVGGFRHPPNIHAARRLVHEVMPRVWRSHPEITARIAGSDMPADIRALASDRVEVLGWVEELDPVLDGARALLAPLTYGAGLKGKVTQSLIAGLPVVTTPIGAEGIPQDDDPTLLVGDDDDQLAAHVIAICTDDTLWQQCSAAGLRAAERVSSPTIARNILASLLA